MPIYTLDFTIPAGTSVNSPVEEDVEIEEYTVERIDVYFPPGCHGVVRIAVFYGAEQLAPKPAGSSLAGNGETVSWPELWRCPEKPATLTFKGWSPSASYDHTVLCRVITRPVEEERQVKEARESQSLIVRFLKHIVGVRT